MNTPWNNEQDGVNALDASFRWPLLQQGPTLNAPEVMSTPIRPDLSFTTFPTEPQFQSTILCSEKHSNSNEPQGKLIQKHEKIC